MDPEQPRLLCDQCPWLDIGASAEETKDGAVAILRHISLSRQVVSKLSWTINVLSA